MATVTTISITLSWDKPMLVVLGIIQIKKEMAFVSQIIRSASLGLSCFITLFGVCDKMLVLVGKIMLESFKRYRSK
jgi:hypothetical protein